MRNTLLTILVASLLVFIDTAYGQVIRNPFGKKPPAEPAPNTEMDDRSAEELYIEIKT